LKPEERKLEENQEGELLLFTRQITLKFGEPPAWAQHKLERATTDQLEAWAERILSADDLETLLKD
jgi:hypothetical protein